MHESRPWRIREIAPDFTLADAWALPVYGGAGDFPHLLEVMASRDLSAPHWVAIAGFAHG